MKYQSSLQLVCGALCAALCLLAAPRAAAQATYKPPGKLTYQGFLTDANGLPLGSSSPVNTNIIFRIYTAPTGGTVKWASQQTVTIDKGHFSVLLGEGTQVGSDPFANDLSGVFTGSDASDRYIEITVNTTPISPRLQLLPAPYALLARNATQVVDQNGNAVLVPYANSVAINKSTAPVSALDVNGTVTATAVSATTFSATTVNATTLSGSGASLTSLSASQLTSGTVPNARLDQNPTVTGTVTANSFVGYGTIPIGGIIMWSGTDAQIPDGWALCNGQTSNGRLTPDLRNRFIIGGGAGGSYTTGATGGNASITLTVGQLPSHKHWLMDYYFAEADPNQGWAGSGDSDSDNSPENYWYYHETEATGNGQSIDIRPPYYALAFIMRVK